MSSLAKLNKSITDFFFQTLSENMKFIRDNISSPDDEIIASLKKTLFVQSKTSAAPISSTLSSQDISDWVNLNKTETHPSCKYIESTGKICAEHLSKKTVLKFFDQFCSRHKSLSKKSTVNLRDILMETYPAEYDKYYSKYDAVLSERPGKRANSSTAKTTATTRRGKSPMTIAAGTDRPTTTAPIMTEPGIVKRIVAPTTRKSRSDASCVSVTRAESVTGRSEVTEKTGRSINGGPIVNDRESRKKFSSSISEFIDKSKSSSSDED